jgi:hypothetical protein
MMLVLLLPHWSNSMSRAVYLTSLIFITISIKCCTAQQRSDPTKFNGGSILAMAVRSLDIQLHLSYFYSDVFHSAHFQIIDAIHNSIVLCNNMYTGPELGSHCHRFTLRLGNANHFICCSLYSQRRRLSRR